jgi:hypothetical protein
VAAIYNRILRDYPEFLALFYHPFYFAHLGEALPASRRSFPTTRAS